MAYYGDENTYRGPQNYSSVPNPWQQQQQPQQNARAGYTQPPAASAPAAAPAAPQNENQSDNSFVSTQIWKVVGKDKVVDFSSKLVKAYAEDFANIHGIGGSEHATNSTICVTICDYSKGKGDKSVTLKYCIDVEDMAQLFHAAKLACVGQLSGATPTAPAVNTDSIAKIDFAVNLMRQWLKIEPYPDNSRPIPQKDLKSAGTALSEALNELKQAAEPAANAVTYSYTRQKNHAYAGSISKINGIDHAPVKEIRIYYNPTRRYPWTIQISNYDAPIKQQASGATTHNSKQAINKKEAFINLSADDFCAAMVAVDRFVRLWEQRMFRVLDAGCTRYEQAIEELKKNNRSGKSR